MLHRFSRTEMLIGSEALLKLCSSKVAVFGIGGVGTYVVEALARSGVGRLVLVDDDVVCLTNINRQLHALTGTIGKPKVEIMRDRVLEINPEAEVTVYQEFYLPDTAERLIHDDYDYIVDAIDTVTGKVDLVIRAKAKSIPIISCMGAANKFDPTKFEVADIYSTSVDPLAKVMRKELRTRGVDSLKVVYSKEMPATPVETDENSCKFHCVCPPGTKRKCTIRRQVPGSMSFVPSAAGLIIAGVVVNDLIKEFINRGCSDV